MAKNKLYWEKEKKRGEKEGKKREKAKRKKEKKKRKKKKERKKRGGGSKQIKKLGKQANKQTNKNHGGVSSDSVYCKSLDLPWNFPVLLGQLFLFSPLGLGGLLGEGPVVLILRC